jgi:hypothetical protein
MSRINGDKARFNRQRKQTIARRKRNHALLKELLAPRRRLPTQNPHRCHLDRERRSKLRIVKRTTTSIGNPGNLE